MCNPNKNAARARPGTLLLLAALLFACAGCETPAPVALSLAPASRAVAKTAPDARARVLEIEVAPVAGQDSGNVFGSRMIVTGLDERLVDALNGAATNDVRFEAKICGTAGENAVRVSFAKAYIHSIYQTKSAVVVLKLEHAGKTDYFRAQRTGLNWSGGDDEFRNALIKAFDEAFAKLCPTLLKIAKTPAAWTSSGMRTFFPVPPCPGILPPRQNFTKNRLPLVQTSFEFCYFYAKTHNTHSLICLHRIPLRLRPETQRSLQSRRGQRRPAGRNRQTRARHPQL